MAVGLLIISHNGIGAALVETALQTLGASPLAVELLSASKDCDPDTLFDQACYRMAKVDRGDGVLVLTDLYGATPGNIANRLMKTHPVRVVTGLSLPMLIRVLNYPQLPLDQLAEKAVSGGRDGVFEVRQPG
jgi:PTS system ascorbate-specific IIA component